jgi:histidinol-phosphatase
MYEHERSFADGLADRAADIGMGLFLGDSLEIRRKADASVVTQADTSIESMVREQVAAAFPDDHVLGEEEGGSADAAERVWIVDPIDATANYARGIPIWATLIALQVRGELVLGLVNAPALNERYVAARGEGALMNDRPIHVSGIGTIADSQLFYAGMKTWLRDPEGEGAAPLGLLAEATRTRGLGDFWGHTLVARGARVPGRGGGSGRPGHPVRRFAHPRRRQRGLVQRHPARRTPDAPVRRLAERMTSAPGQPASRFARFFAHG